jgi:hypothetical protein
MLIHIILHYLYALLSPEYIRVILITIPFSQFTGKKMKKTTIIIMLLILTLPSMIVFAGNKNQNDDHGNSAAATGKENNLDGCNVPENAHDVWVYIPPEDVVWLGGACCASNIEVFDGVYFPNQCCNPPDFIPGPGVPGNHCECFANRGFQEL